jgi:hypothetical protein
MDHEVVDHPEVFDHQSVWDYPILVQAEVRRVSNNFEPKGTAEPDLEGSPCIYRRATEGTDVGHDGMARTNEIDVGFIDEVAVFLALNRANKFDTRIERENSLKAIVTTGILKFS